MMHFNESKIKTKTRTETETATVRLTNVERGPSLVSQLPQGGDARALPETWI